MTGDKVNNKEFITATRYLREAGYPAGGFAAYVLLGMPGQDLAEVGEAIHFAHAASARVNVAEYSPIPGTADWERVKEGLPSPDPLRHNNSLFPLFPLTVWTRLHELKNLAPISTGPSRMRYRYHLPGRSTIHPSGCFT